MSEADIDGAAQALELSVRQFTAKYAHLGPERRGLILREHPDGSCILLSHPNDCLIQSVKPQQCRDFPNRWRFDGFEHHCAAIRLDYRRWKLHGVALDQATRCPAPKRRPKPSGARDPEGLRSVR